LKEKDPEELRWLVRAQIKREEPNRELKTFKKKYVKKSNKKQINVQKPKK